ncbi:MAG: phosphonate ABC transporter, permease protein PhnE, partial [Spirochaetales bacterium]|nr:phosphonate ABC transporter, permease protein PhnE [Spirochaetales bacterium]
MSTTSAATVWKRDHFIKNPWLRWIIILAGAAYLIYALNDMNFNLARMKSGWPRAVDFFQRMFPPDYSRWTMIHKGVFESLQMAIIATTVSILLAIPLSLAAAANISTRFVYVIA